MNCDLERSVVCARKTEERGVGVALCAYRKNTVLFARLQPVKMGNPVKWCRRGQEDVERRRDEMEMDGERRLERRL